MLNDFYLHLGEMIYENVASGERWFTALDPESRLYFYSIDPDTLETRSEWSLPVHPVSAESRDKVGIMTLTALSILQLRFKSKSINPIITMIKAKGQHASSGTQQLCLG